MVSVDIFKQVSMILWGLLAAILWLNCCHGQRQGLASGFMPGVAPSSPNNALNVCYRQATPRPQNRTYRAQNARVISTWCSVYDDVLPCLDRTLTSATRASDIYLKLIYNVTMATRMSESICQRLPFLYDLTCVEEGMDRVMRCMNWTDSVIEHFYSQFIPARPLTTDRQEMANIYACIISVTTAMCFQKELTSCSFYQRKLMYDYYIMLSGKCREVAGMPETTTQGETTTSTDTGTSDATTVSTSQTTEANPGTSRGGRARTQTPRPGSSNNGPRTDWSRNYNGCSTVRTHEIMPLLMLMLMKFFDVLL